LLLPPLAVEINGTPDGGVALLVKMEFLTVRFHLIPACKPLLYVLLFTVCSIYLPPTTKYDNAVIDHFITQLPSPVLLLGDFNAHSHLWPWALIFGNSLNDVST